MVERVESSCTAGNSRGEAYLASLLRPIMPDLAGAFGLAHPGQSCPRAQSCARAGLPPRWDTPLYHSTSHDKCRNRSIVLARSGIYAGPSARPCACCSLTKVFRGVQAVIGHQSSCIGHATLTCYILHLVILGTINHLGARGRLADDDGRCLGVVLVLGLAAASSLPFPREHLAALCWANGEWQTSKRRSPLFTRTLTRVLRSTRPWRLGHARRRIISRPG
jgi:hypothetical protein